MSSTVICSSGGAAVDAPAMRNAMGMFATGVAVVTTIAGGQPHGMTVNSLTSVSLDPALLLVCLTNDARSTAAVVGAGRMAVSILSSHQEAVAVRFAARGQDHFGRLPLEYGTHTVPVVPDALVHLECAVRQQVVAGDHLVVFGQVERVCRRPGAPLLFLSGRFGEVNVHGDEQRHWFF